MKRATCIAVSVCVLVSAACVLVVRAAPGPDTSKSKTKFSTLTVTPKRVESLRAHLRMKKARIDVGTATPTSGTVLSEADLHTMLDNMGLNPTSGTNSDGSKWESINEPHGDWTFAYTLSLSSDQSNIWITTWCDQVKDQDNVKASYWYTLLSMGDTLWPAYFSYDIQDSEITASLALPNSNVTPAKMRSTLDTFSNNLSATSSAWDTSKWNTSAPAAAPSAPAAPSGS